MPKIPQILLAAFLTLLAASCAKDPDRYSLNGMEKDGEWSDMGNRVARKNELANTIQTFSLPGRSDGAQINKFKLISKK
ncbi:MAG: hypothetical protein H6581_10835 [Bacteroidia bacterium]|nr:hypothetical protein [Bacteroidia bacterium]